MADWTPPDRYAGTLVLPGQLGPSSAPPAEQESPFDAITTAIDRLYEREPRLTRDLLEAFRSATVADLERLLLP
jgi:hypothetical protein